GQYGAVTRIAETILGSTSRASAVAFPKPLAAEHAEQVYACTVRLVAHMARRLSSRERDVAQDKADLSSVLHILKAISSKRCAHDILYVFVQQIARVVPMRRCSVVRVWGGEQRGHVLASHEDPSVRDLVIELSKYPEIVEAMEQRDKVVVNDVLKDPRTKPFAAELAHSGITSLVVIPLVLFDQNVGSLVLRGARGAGPFSTREISFCEIVAEAAANALERANLFEGLQRVNERLEVLAVTDDLTGLYNHRYFRERLEEECARAQRYQLPLSCIILDVDDFKRVNDTYGHLTGDCVLREIAARTSQMVRKSDIVARYGGEEFVVIMPQTDLEGAHTQAERIRKGICEKPFDGLPEDDRVTVSIGTAVFDTQTMQDCEALIRTADEALYEAKKAGKNCVVTKQRSVEGI
ncbi:MAG TPA: sensor domain-containing diguanylate cyclase, partial [Candidatus Hydrogenedentes bacterium]|nr:sensor domain-containing diguanylate cyclase [Candidatus Hydrogenedentota bacterium]